MSEPNSPASKLLIVSCSSRKIEKDGLVAAWALYDGVAFRLMKRLQREKRFPPSVKILILSARYGLIRPEDEITNYDQRMTPARANELAAASRLYLQEIFSAGDYREVFAALGTTYLSALRPLEEWLPQNTSFTVPPGGIGLKLRALKIWLTAAD